MSATRVLGVTALLAVATSVPAVQARDAATFNLRATVPLSCSLNMRPALVGAENDESYNLGTFTEYCNSPSGYQIVVQYTPGTLNGAMLTAGNDTIVLTGSGRAVLTRSTGPQIRERSLTILPGEAGFDTSSFSIDIVPT